MLRTLIGGGIAAAGAAATLALAAPASADTISTPVGDFNADTEGTSLTNYRYSAGYTSPKGTISLQGYSYGTPDDGIHSNIELRVGELTVANHQHYGYNSTLFENRFTVNNNTITQIVPLDGPPMVLLNGEPWP